jgi:hypothetical protein
MTREGWRRAALVALALAGLNVALSHVLWWPTPIPVPDHRISTELVWLWCVLLAVAAWRGGVPPRVVSAAALAVTALAIGRYVDVAARDLFGRPIHLYWDGQQIPRFLSVAADGRVGRWASAAGLVAAVAFVAWALYRGLRAALAVVARDAVPVALHSPAALVATAGLAALSLANHAGVRATWPVVAAPVLPTWVRQADLLAAAYMPSRLAGRLPASPAFDGPFAALRGTDLAIVMFESYGAVAFDDAAMHAALAPGRERLARSIAGSGRGVVSAFVTSPTFGGASELAHLSLLSGIDLSDPLRHDLLITTDRPTLTGALRARGWRTFGLYPALSWDWPEKAFYGFDTFLDGRDLGWRGPRLGYWWIPDQFTIERFEQLHPSRAGDAPRMLFFPTITSHVPFRPVPPFQPDRARLLGATPYDPADVGRALADRVDWLDLRPAYVGMIGYTYDWLGAWIGRRRERAETVVIVGDHQPTAAVTGEGARWDVPVHVASDDPALLDRLVAMGFVRGLEPARAPIGAMHMLTTKLLAAFDGRIAPGATP